MEEVEQPEAEALREEGKRAKLSNGTLPDGTSSPEDSGHPSSQNFSLASAYSERGFSTEDSMAEASKPAGGSGGGLQGATPREDGLLEGLPGQDSLAGDSSRTFGELGPLGTEEEASRPAVGRAEGWADHGLEQQNSTGSEDDLLEEPEMESLYPQLDPHALAVTDLTAVEVSPVSSSGVTYSVSGGGGGGLLLLAWPSGISGGALGVLALWEGRSCRAGLPCWEFVVRPTKSGSRRRGEVAALSSVQMPPP